MIKAIKNGNLGNFSEAAWESLGQNKEGWTKVNESEPAPEEVVKDLAKKQSPAKADKPAKKDKPEKQSPAKAEDNQAEGNKDASNGQSEDQG